MAKPVVDRLERELQGQLQVLRLSVWSSIGRQFAARHGVRGVPTFLLFDRGGRMVHYQVGRLDGDRAKAELNALGR